MDTKEIIRETDEKMKKTVEATGREFATVRTGRASSSLVEGIRVDCYGSQMIIKQVANISTPDPKSIVIQPWDQSNVGSIEKAIMKSDLGITPTVDGKVIRINLPQLTKDRKEELIKLIKNHAEDGKVSLRTARRDANDHVNKLFKDKKIPEDAKFAGLEDIQKLTDNHTKEIEQLLEKKEKEIQEG
jgi:ribosome recycling factor